MSTCLYNNLGLTIDGSQDGYPKGSMAVTAAYQRRISIMYWTFQGVRYHNRQDGNFSVILAISGCHHISSNMALAWLAGKLKYRRSERNTKANASMACDNVFYNLVYVCATGMFSYAILLRSLFKNLKIPAKDARLWRSNVSLCGWGRYFLQCRNKMWNPQASR